MAHARSGISFIFLRVSTSNGANLYTPERNLAEVSPDRVWETSTRSNMITCFTLRLCAVEWSGMVRQAGSGTTNERARCCMGIEITEMACLDLPTRWQHGCSGDLTSVENFKCIGVTALGVAHLVLKADIAVL